MLVFSDRQETVDVQQRLRDLSAAIHSISEMPAGLERHAKLVAALIEAGQVHQGLADSGRSEAGDFGRFMHALAASVVRSWDSRFAEIEQLPAVPETNIGGCVELKIPEGFAFYAVYPEAYIAAARRLQLLAKPMVIGIRSIGTTLSAMVAATLGCPPPITVRPYGDPFKRRVELPASAIEKDAHYIIVDEGPGLSGSSFGAVADSLQECGVSLDRIACIPSHAGGPGPQVSSAHLAQWQRMQRVPAQFDPWFLKDRFGKLEEFATGHPGEQLKFLAATGPSDRVLVKFAGLTAIGERKFAHARALYEAGLTAEPLGLLHGFLVERWVDGSPLGGSDKPMREIGRYVGARARLLPAPEGSGASVDELIAMCRRNVELAFGNELAQRIDHIRAPTPSARVRTDNKLDRKEWLRLPDGRLLKSDALDHHVSHDLIGCQPVEWDVAGAAIEFDLEDNETDELISATALPIDRALVRFFRVAYAAFRTGQAALASDHSEARYGAKLRSLLQQTH